MSPRPPVPGEKAPPAEPGRSPASRPGRPGLLKTVVIGAAVVALVVWIVLLVRLLAPAV